MGAILGSPPVLDAGFARELSELAVPWRAEDAPDPELVVLNEPLAAELGLDAAWLRTPAGIRFLLGQRPPDDAVHVAQAYSGHQFGFFAPVLGDGRAVLLGEIVDPAGRRRDVHLKGAGPTPFARGGDGRAVLGPMLREFLVSEAMHALGIRTTRSLAVLTTGHRVLRRALLPGAVLVRVADSHLRVGSFQFARARGEEGLLRRVADHAIARLYPDAADAASPYLTLFERVVSAQATLIAQWMNVGFVHGVMNTDNTTISGETIDYGPCAFMEHFDPAVVFSSIDERGRYAYGRQPLIAEWNLARLAEALLPLLDADTDTAVEIAQTALSGFRRQYSDAWSTGLRAKLGLSGSDDETAVALIDELMPLMRDEHPDLTSFFRALGRVDDEQRTPVLDLVVDRGRADAWLTRWLAAGPDRELMDRTNPIHIPRNHLVEEALAAADQGDLAPFDWLLGTVTAPYVARPGLERYAAPAPDAFWPYVTYCGT